jgi:thiol-disulfide isomerase/thioredoxin
MAAASPSALSTVRGLPGRVGQTLLAPRAAFERVERHGGGVTDALWLVALGTGTFRFPQLLEALLALSQPSLDALLRVVSVFSHELLSAAFVVLPAAFALTLLAGRARDSARDLELGAACYGPYFAANGAFRLVEAVTGARTWAPAVAVFGGAVVALPAFVQAMLLVWRRGKTAPPDLLAAVRRSDVAAGLVLVGACAVALAGNAVWSSRHLSELLPVRKGTPAADFALARVDGSPGTVSLASLRGQVVVLDFWATYCPPCRQMMPVLDALHHEWSPRGVSFVGVDSEDIDPAMLREFLAQHPIPYPVVADDGATGSSFKVRALPTLVVIGRDGSVRDSFVGYTMKGTLARAIERAMN